MRSLVVVMSLVGCAASPATEPRVDVRDFGARGDGATDDTAAIQAALDAPGVTTVVIGDGTYLVDPARGVVPHSGQTVELSAGATLQIVPNALPGYDLIRIEEVDGVTVRGGTLAGDRDGHVLPDGFEDGHGHGVTILGGTNIVIDGVRARDFWGDGFYIGESERSVRSVAIQITNNVADHNRRQGLSITDATNVVITNNEFLDTDGTPPEAGIDLEPSFETEVVRDIQIVDNSFVGNAYGIQLVQLGGVTENVLISNNSIQHNVVDGVFMIGAPSTVLIHRNVIRGNGDGILLQDAEDSRIEDNLIELNPHGGVILTGTNRIALSGNQLYANGDPTTAYDNINLTAGSVRNVIERNVVRSGDRPTAARYGIQIESADCADNTILANDLACAGVSGALADHGTRTLVLENTTRSCATYDPANE